MSMKTNCIYGYGFKVYVSDENLRLFIEKHEETIRKIPEGTEILDWVQAHVGSGRPLDALKEKFFDYENEVTGDTGIYGLIADVMIKETGIDFEFRNPQDSDDDDVIIFPECYPWQLNETEKTLTQEKLDEILNTYIADLGGQLKAEYIRLEF